MLFVRGNDTLDSRHGRCALNHPSSCPGCTGRPGHRCVRLRSDLCFQLPEFTDIDPTLGEAGAWLSETHPDSIPFIPHIIVERRQAWLTGDPEAKAKTDLFINRVEGSMDGEPATGCQVGGHGSATGATIAEITGAFDSSRFIGTIEYDWTTNSSWVVEKGGQRGLLTLVDIPGIPNPGPGGFSFALEFPSASVIAKLLPH